MTGGRGWNDGGKGDSFVDWAEDWGVAVKQVGHRDGVGSDLDGHWLQVLLVLL